MTSSIGSPFFWTAFVICVLLLLLLDLGVLHRRARTVSFRMAALWSAVWVTLSLSFGTWVYLRFGAQKGLEFFTGYLIEYALSVDNIFIFVIIFSYFAVPAKLHHRVLFWGILGALVMRAGFILAGAALLQAFHWIIYVFGAFLVFTGWKIMCKGSARVEPERNPIVRVFHKVFPMVPGYGSGRFLVRQDGKWFATPLTLVLVTVETTDVVFAVDSIPAIFGVTRDPFVVYTSNVCAILGLRSMYFLLAAVVDRFVYLGTGLGIVLVFVGFKMLLSGVYHIPIALSLAVVITVLAISVLLSLLKSRRAAVARPSTPD